MINDLDKLYDKYNKKEYIHPDPFEMVCNFNNKNDQEIVGLIASSFAVGNVFQILKFLKSVFDQMGNRPYDFFKNCSEPDIETKFKGFYYRYYKDVHIIEFFVNIKKVVVKYESLENWVMDNYNKDDETFFPLFKRLSAEFNLSSPLIPKSSGNSAFKRLALYFRWMVREDRVDLGLWKGLPASKLIIPLDIHMTNISKILGFTKSASNSMSNVLKITKEFANLNPDDPVKWDFALSRLGIHPDLDYEELVDLIRSN
ncbi:MAG: TIGR02757 family protein [Spirochaetaceae bacterium]